MQRTDGNFIFDAFPHIFTVTVVVGRQCPTLSSHARVVHLLESPRLTALSRPRFCVHAPSSQPEIPSKKPSMDPLSLSLVQSVLAPLRLARDAIQGAREIKETLRDRYADYVSMLEPLNQSPGKVKDKGIEHELQRLKDLFNKVKDLVHNHIANSGDSKLEKTNKITKRAAFHTEINEDLEAIDAEVMRQLQIISTKGAISIAEIMKSFEERIRALITLIKINTPVAPTRTKPKVDVISAELVKMGQLSGPWLLLDVLEKRDAEQTNNASLARLIALHTTVQEHFYHVVWVKVGMTDKDRTEAILQRLASELARDAALSEAAALPVTTFDSPDEALRSITAAEEHVPRLVVLEDVRDRGLVDALRGTGLQLLVCASDRSVVAAKAGCTEVADLTEDEKSQVQVKTGEWMDQTEKDVWTVSFRVSHLLPRSCQYLQRAVRMRFARKNNFVPLLFETAAQVCILFGKVSSTNNYWPINNVVLVV